MLRSALAAALLAAGRRARPRHLVLLDAAVGHVALGRWLATEGVGRTPTVKRREDLFAMALPVLQDAARPLYLELGVHQGASLRWWADHLTAVGAALHGFDSFQGLPEAWNEQHGAGRFSTGGQAPVIDDDRVQLFVGWFDETLPAYRAPDHDALFINLDADLYSSTMTALRALRPLIREGTWLYFDQLNDKHHELRALQDFLEHTGTGVDVVARAANGRHWLLRVARAPSR
jgi:hypothetical protein